jgi:glycolate oxidase iron-sulfur subunit
MTKTALNATDSLKELQQALAYNDTFNCVKCGYCLPACPTYVTMGKETHSPRGRIQLVKMAAEGKLKDFSLLSDSIDKCLGCRACETACPTGVKYGNIYESAKNVIQQKKQTSPMVRMGRTLLFRHLFPNKRLLNSLAGLLWLYQASGLEKLTNRLQLTSLLPQSISGFAKILPRQTSPLKRYSRANILTPKERPKFRIAFFSGCIMDAMFERINRLSMQLLQAAGCEVVLVPKETCCGALHAHAGERELAKEMAKRNIAAFESLNERTEIDFVVNNAGGCGAMLVEYGHLLHDEPEWKERAERYAAKTKDISEILAQLDTLPFLENGNTKSGSHIVTYQRSCHMTNVQKVTAPPLKLIRAVPGTELTEMEDKDKCCGSAGIYNVVNYEESMDILDVKMKSASKTLAQTVITTNPGCLLQMQLGIEREGLQDRMRAVHLVEFLAEACGIS